MLFHPASSRTRYRQYLAKVRAKRRSQGRHAGSEKDSEAPKKRTRSFLQLLRGYFGLLHGQTTILAAALATLAIATVIGLIQPAATKIVVDFVLLRKPLPADWPGWLAFPNDPARLLAYVAGAIVGLAVISTLIGLAGRWQATRTMYMLKATVRRRVFEHAVRLPLPRIYQLKSGGMASILNEDTGTLSDLIFSMLYNPCRAIVQLIGSLIILALVDWRLLIGSLVLVPSVYFTHRTWISRIRPLYRDIHMARQEIDGQVTEAFGGIRVVRSFGRAKSEAGRFVRSNQLRARQEVHVWWWARGVDLAWALLIPVASAGLMWYGGTRVLAGALSVGDLMMFLAYLVMLFGPLETLAVSATQFQSGLAGLDRVLDLLAEPLDMPAGAESLAVDRQAAEGRISIRHVSFTYPGAKEAVLHDIRLEVKPGELIALVGPSGAGKTTLCNLIARFYDPTEGRIEFDGTDLRRIDADSYRRLLGIVEQDIFLFDGTVAENIGYARRHVTMEQVRRAALLANADEFIAGFEKGYETVIGERGVKLSGGQRQRLAIARALLADPRILILDEATSNLDTHSERLIQTSLETLMRGRTSFVIAHRLSTIARADRIIVLERGRIVEQGTHEELMARSGAYRKMVDLQTQPVQTGAVVAVPALSRS